MLRSPNSTANWALPWLPWQEPRYGRSWEKAELATEAKDEVAADRLLRSFVEVKSIGGPGFPLPLPGPILTEMATWLPDWPWASTITTRSKRRNSPMS